MIYPMSSQSRLPTQVLHDHVLASRQLLDRQLVVTLTFNQSFSHSFLLISKCFTGVEHVGGNMLESVPSGDTIFMKVLN